MDVEKLNDDDLKTLLRNVEQELTRREIQLPQRGRRASKQYRNPDNQWDVWQGIGRRPKWLNDYIKKGGDIEDLRC